LNHAGSETLIRRSRSRQIFTFLPALLLAALGAACGGTGSGDSSPEPPPPAAGELLRQTIDLAAYPDARCNDGTPAVFYIDTGRGAAAAADANKTVLYLRGGGYCVDDASCQTREAALRSSAGYPDRATVTGVLSGGDDNPFFQSWNRVVVSYCSSDFYSGDTGPVGGVSNFQFRGSKILDAVIGTLRSRYNIGRSGDVVLFAGGSAGAVGAFINANRIKAAMPGATVMTLIDGGVFPDVPPPMPHDPPLTRVSDLGAEGISYWNGQLDPACIAANSANPGLCYLFEHAASTLDTPFFVVQNAKDQVSIINSGLLDSDSIDNASAIASWVNSTFFPQMAAILGNLGLATGEGVFGICAPLDVHVLSTDSATWTAPYAEFGGRSLATTVASWVAGGGTASRDLANPSGCSFP